jgi:hypothetical protein
MGLPSFQSVDRLVPCMYCRTIAGCVRASHTLAREALIVTVFLASKPLAI